MKFIRVIKSDLLSREELIKKMEVNKNNFINSEKFQKVYDYVLKDIEKDINNRADLGHTNLERGFWNYLEFVERELKFNIFTKDFIVVLNKIFEKLIQLGYNAKLEYPGNSAKIIINWGDEDK